MGLLLLLVAGVLFRVWWRAPERRVPRLLREKRSIPVVRFVFPPRLFGPSSEQIDAAFDEMGAEAVPALILSLEDRDPEVRRFAAIYLRKLGDGRAVEPLIRHLGDEYERHWAVEALGKLRDARAVGAVVGCLRDKDSAIRRCAAKALGEISDRSAVAPLLSMLDDPNDFVRQNAIIALGHLGDPRAIEPLLRKFTDKDDEGARYAACESLAEIGDPAALPKLEAYARTGTEPYHQAKAREAIARIRDRGR